VQEFFSLSSRSVPSYRHPSAVNHPETKSRKGRLDRTAGERNLHETGIPSNLIKVNSSVNSMIKVNSRADESELQIV